MSNAIVVLCSNGGEALGALKMSTEVLPDEAKLSKDFNREELSASGTKAIKRALKEETAVVCKKVRFVCVSDKTASSILGKAKVEVGAASAIAKSDAKRKKGKKEKKPKKEGPKKQTGFMLFSTQRRPALTGELKDKFKDEFKQSLVMSELGNEWKKLGMEGQTRYNEQAHSNYLALVAAQAASGEASASASAIVSMDDGEASNEPPKDTSDAEDDD